MFNIKELRDGNFQEDSLVVMSGGMDSTLILLKEVERIKKSGKGHVDIMYHDSDRILKSKRKMELDSINNILSKIKEVYDIEVKMLIHTSEASVIKDANGDGDLSIGVKYGCGMMLPQSVVWTGMILDIMPDLSTTKTNILYGFNLADNFHAYSANMIKETIENFYTLMKMGDVDSVLNVAFPLINYDKEYIYRTMLDEYYEFYNLTWTCEMPKDDMVCGECVPCKTKYSTLTNILITNNIIDGASEFNKAQSKINKLYGLKKQSRDIFKKIDSMKNNFEDDIIEEKGSDING